MMRITEFETSVQAGDAGICLTGYCPKCGDRVEVAEHQWWRSICSCRIEWSLHFHIESDEPEDEVIVGGIRIRDTHHLTNLLDEQRKGICVGTKYRAEDYNGKVRTYHFGFVMNWSYFTMSWQVGNGMMLVIDDGES